MLHRAWQPQADKPVAAHHGLTNALALAAAKGQVLEVVGGLVGHRLVHGEALGLEDVRVLPQLGGAAQKGEDCRWAIIGAMQLQGTGRWSVACPAGEAIGMGRLASATRPHMKQSPTNALVVVTVPK